MMFSASSAIAVLAFLASVRGQCDTVVNKVDLVIANPGFETPVLANRALTQVVEGWTKTRGNSGVVNPSNGQMASQPTNGNNIMYLSSTNGVVEQTLAAIVQQDKVYDFTFQIGDRGDQAFRQYQVELYGGTTLLYSESNLVTPNNEMVVREIRIDPIDPANPAVGGVIRIVLTSLGGGGQVMFDNFAIVEGDCSTLTQSSTPPTTPTSTPTTSATSSQSTTASTTVFTGEPPCVGPEFVQLRGQPFTYTPTGDVEVDFDIQGDAAIFIDEFPDVRILGQPDRISGWDIKDVRFRYNFKTDTAYFGINCATTNSSFGSGICGDADGDGNPEGGAPWFPGIDAARYGGTENFVLLLDTDADTTTPSTVNPYEVAIGIPSIDELSSFGTYFWDETAVPAAPNFFMDTLNPCCPTKLTTYIGGQPNVAQPDLEFEVANFLQLPGFAGNVLRGDPFRFNFFLLHSGGNQDVVISEDIVQGSFCIVEAPTTTATTTPTTSATTTPSTTQTITPLPCSGGIASLDFSSNNINFTGDASADFGADINAAVVEDILGDVSYVPNPNSRVSGWDIDRVFFLYDYVADVGHFGIRCGDGICGDADGDGSPNSSTTAGAGDNAAYSGSENLLFLLDTDADDTTPSINNPYEAAIGMPATGDLNDFGVYFWPLGAVPTAASSFVTTRATCCSTTVFGGESGPSAGAPSFEFSVGNFSSLNGFTFTPGESFKFGFRLQHGAGALDPQIGDDLVESEFCVRSTVTTTQTQRTTTTTTTPTIVTKPPATARCPNGTFILSTGSPTTFTGNAAIDFAGIQGVVDLPFPDVAILKVNSEAATRTSGWDVVQVFFNYDPSTDTAFFGVDCAVAPGQTGSGICGDADGDGDPGGRASWMQGEDLPNYEGTEQLILLIDTDNDRTTPSTVNGGFESAIGVPIFEDLSQFATYQWGPTASVQTPDFFLTTPEPCCETTLFSYNNVPEVHPGTFLGPNRNQPDIEFTVSNFTSLPGFNYQPDSQLTFRFRLVHGGGIQDIMISEDIVNSKVCLDIFTPTTQTTTVTTSPTTSGTTTPEPTTNDICPGEEMTLANTRAIDFSGNSAIDFDGTTSVQFSDPVGDVAVFANTAQALGTTSGWDISNVTFSYDFRTDTAYFGITCGVQEGSTGSGICGDADGDGNPSSAASWMPGIDAPKYGGTEQFVMLLDTNFDQTTPSLGNPYEAVVGIPLVRNLDSFDVYDWAPTAIPSAADVFMKNKASCCSASVYASPTALIPDLQFSVGNFSKLNGFDFLPGESFRFNFLIYHGGGPQDVIFAEEEVTGSVCVESIDVTTQSTTPTTTATTTGAPCFGEQMFMSWRKPAFTGDAPVDFAQPGVDAGSVNDSFPDVAVFPSNPDMENRISGWDVENVFFTYDFRTDIGYFGIDCGTLPGSKGFGICGDAEGDGDPGASASFFAGIDNPEFRNAEQFTLLLDTDTNPSTPSFINGYEAFVGLPLTEGLEFFDTYVWPANGVDIAPDAFVSVGSPEPCCRAKLHSYRTDVHLNTTLGPNAVEPDLEFSIENFSELPGFTFKPGQRFSFSFRLSMGGGQADLTISEEVVEGTFCVEDVIRTTSQTTTASTTPFSTTLSTTATTTGTTTQSQCPFGSQISPSNDPIFLTGNAAVDFPSDSFVTDPLGDVAFLAVNDIAANRSTGFDIGSVHFHYDYSVDRAYFGINCGVLEGKTGSGICGDADGDGDPGAKERWNPGLDLPNYEQGEQFVILLNTDNDPNTPSPSNRYETAIGIPAGRDLSTFSTYQWPSNGIPAAADFFLGTVDSCCQASLFSYNQGVHAGTTIGPTASQPDLEFTIDNFSKLPGFSFQPGRPFDFDFLLLHSGGHQSVIVSEESVFGAFCVEGKDLTTFTTTATTTQTTTPEPCIGVEVPLRPGAAPPTFSGDAFRDFRISAKPPAAVTEPIFPDVVVFDSNPEVSEQTSGWDVKTVFFVYDSVTDIAYFGIDCAVAPGQSGSGICGDADGDGDPGASAPWNEGADNPNYDESEDFVLLLNTDNDASTPSNRNPYESAIGIPFREDLSAFGTYKWPVNAIFAQPAPFLTEAETCCPTTLFDYIPNVHTGTTLGPNVAQPDLEFSVENFSQLPGFTFVPGDSFRFSFRLIQSGGLADITFGEEVFDGQVCITSDSTTLTTSPSTSATTTPTTSATSTISTTPEPPCEGEKLELSSDSVPPIFSGIITNDFPTMFSATVNDTYPDVAILNVSPEAATAISGWDISGVTFAYDFPSDKAFFGVRCGFGINVPGRSGSGICGDADGNGNPDGVEPWMATGVDQKNYASGEQFIFLLDTNNDLNSPSTKNGYEAVFGIPANEDITKFGTYQWPATAVDFAPALFLDELESCCPSEIFRYDSLRRGNRAPSETQPDFEFSVENFSKLPGFNFVKGQDFTFGFRVVHGGSQGDLFIAEDVADGIFCVSGLDVTTQSTTQTTTLSTSATTTVSTTASTSATTTATSTPSTTAGCDGALVLLQIRATAPVLTGNTSIDFQSGPFGLVADGFPDVAVLPLPQTENLISGWDVRGVYFTYNQRTDVATFGVDCASLPGFQGSGICGDADADGDPGAPAPWNFVGDDSPNYGRAESFVLLLDTDNNGATPTTTNGYEVAVGLPLGSDLTQFATYQWPANGLVESADFFLETPETCCNASLFSYTPNVHDGTTLGPNANQPDLEFQIESFSQLPGFSFIPGDDFDFSFVIQTGGGLSDLFFSEETVQGRYCVRGFEPTTATTTPTTTATTSATTTATTSDVPCPGEIVPIGVQPPIFTGNAVADFLPSISAAIADPIGDVAIASNIRQALRTTSGWDMENVFFSYDERTDRGYFGIDCGIIPGSTGSGICGDADGDGNPSAAAPWMTGLDLPNYGATEQFVMLIDTDNNATSPSPTNRFEVAVGIPLFSDISQFGTYKWDASLVPENADRFITDLETCCPSTLFSYPTGAPDSSAPDLEFYIDNFSQLPGFIAQDFEFSITVAHGAIEDLLFSNDQVNGVFCGQVATTATTTPTTSPSTSGTTTPTTTGTTSPTTSVTTTPTTTPTTTHTSTPTTTGSTSATSTQSTTVSTTVTTSMTTTKTTTPSTTPTTSASTTMTTTLSTSGTTSRSSTPSTTATTTLSTSASSTATTTATTSKSTTATTTPTTTATTTGTSSASTTPSTTPTPTTTFTTTPTTARPCTGPVFEAQGTGGITFTGSPEDDFPGVTGSLTIADGFPDVSILPVNAEAASRVSGWDIRDFYFHYDSATDIAYFGIQCGTGADAGPTRTGSGICGDADGNGDPGTVESWMSGVDTPNYGSVEQFTLLIDTNNNGDTPTSINQFETAIGMAIFQDLNDFKTYQWPSTAFPDAPESFLQNEETCCPTTLFNYLSPTIHPGTTIGPNANEPGLEFSVQNFSQLPGFDFTPGQNFQFRVKISTGGGSGDIEITEDTFTSVLCGE